jgi:hypothetical protein
MGERERGTDQKLSAVDGERSVVEPSLAVGECSKGGGVVPCPR